MNNKALYAKLAAIVIIAIVYGYFALCGFSIAMSGSTAGLYDVGRATAVIISALTGRAEKPREIEALSAAARKG